MNNSARVVHHKTNTPTKVGKDRCVMEIAGVDDAQYEESDGSHVHFARKAF